MNSTNDRPAAPIYYLSASEVVEINDRVTDGNAAIRDLHLLDSALLRPALVLFGEAQFPDLIDKAAALLESFAYHHLFYDGNKRTAVEAVTLFLARNGLRFDYEAGRDAAFILEVAKGATDLAMVGEWLRGHVTGNG